MIGEPFDPWHLVYLMAGGLLAGFPTIYFVAKAGVKAGLISFNNSLEGIQRDLSDYKAAETKRMDDARRYGMAAYQEVEALKKREIEPLRARVTALEVRNTLQQDTRIAALEAKDPK